jgi:hypothetical protein
MYFAILFFLFFKKLLLPFFLFSNFLVCLRTLLFFRFLKE